MFYLPIIDDYERESIEKEDVSVSSRKIILNHNLTVLMISFTD